VHIKLGKGDGKRDLDATNPLESVESPDRHEDDMDVDGEEDDIVVDDGGMAAMQAMMGFGNFDTTKGKKVKGNNVGAVRKEKTTEYRQYMNRVGGFNRPLSPGR
jgi:U4/U6.U5 tri-snRNP-associated protein 3